MPDVPLIVHCLRAGVQAPSADNSQPWRFDCSQSEIALFVDKQRTGLFFDANRTATLMSCGAVIENMVLEAGRLGWTARVSKATNSGTTAEPVARLVFDAPTPAQPSELADAISMRATHRGLYRSGERLEPAAQKAIQAGLHDLNGFHLYWCNSADRKKHAMRSVFGADLVRFTHPQIHRDFHHMLRFGNAIRDSRDGLAEDTLGIERALLLPLRGLSPWPLARVLNGLGLHYFMAWRGAWLPMQTAAGIGILTADPLEDHFDAGRALQRVWLASTAAGLDFQPVGALPLLLARLHEMAGEGLTPVHQRKIQTLDQRWKKACGLPDDTPQRLVMIFRVGHARRPTGKAQRRPLRDFLTEPCARNLADHE